ncbi:hypothetical protein Ancab_007583 [Ancistrocladus abbreviatus]
MVNLSTGEVSKLSAHLNMESLQFKPFVVNHWLYVLDWNSWKSHVTRNHTSFCVPCQNGTLVKSWNLHISMEEVSYRAKLPSLKYVYNPQNIEGITNSSRFYYNL